MATKYLKNNHSTIAAEYHILNGDALSERFPQSLAGDRIICREMLMDGPLSETLDDSFYEKRSMYIDALLSKNAKYMSFVKPQLEQLRNLPDNSVVYLWFEPDLFCQVNLWSCVTWLAKYGKELKLFLVQPLTNDWKSFGWMSEEELSQAYSMAKLLEEEDIQVYQEALELYITKDVSDLEQYCKQSAVQETVSEAISAELTRLPNAEGKVVLHQIIENIAKEENADFVRSFKRFTREHGNYGLGDLQFQILFDELVG